MLIRALEPLDGHRARCARAAAASGLEDLCSGPGKLTQALGHRAGAQRHEPRRRAGPRSSRAPARRAAAIVVGTRIGITQRGRPAVALLRGRQPLRLAAVAAGPARPRRSARRRADAAGLGAAGAAAVRRRVPARASGVRRAASGRASAPASGVRRRRRRRRRRAAGSRCRRPCRRCRRALPSAPVAGAVAVRRRRRRRSTGVSSAADGSVASGGRLAVALGLALGDPLLEDRAAWTTKSRQICAGNVPPATGSPPNSVFIGVSLSG